MTSLEPENPRPSNVTAKRQPVKRKRETTSTRTATPHAYARRSPPRRDEAAPIEDEDDEDGDRAPLKKLKRPGAGARINREAVEAARKQREEQDRASLANRQVTSADLVAAHYNAVPERGREWRTTDSQIKGLRSLNNWIKSTLIQKFSKPEVISEHGVTVLDMACGKGGDLGKWEKAPITPALYVGCDIADVSIDQAKQRHAETLRRHNPRHRRQPMQAQFYVQDTFGSSLDHIPIIRQVGFNPNAGPGNGVIGGGMMTGGFDVVSMMFALHYSFEREDLARQMLKNVAGALKKGGRFFGVMPNSDVITSKVKQVLQSEAAGQTPATQQVSPEESGTENGGGSADEVEEEWDPEKPADEDDDNWDPEAPSEPAAVVASALPSDLPAPNGTTSAQDAPLSKIVPDPDQPPLEWGNSIYKVRFSRHQPLTNRPLPRDGIFRPPYGWKYHYSLEEAVNAAEYVVPWEGFRALAEDYGLELLYRKGFREVFEDESGDKELGMLAERMGVMSRNRAEGRGGLLVSDEEMEAASFYHAFCFYKT
nr:mrna cap guanine-n7 methyltransferase [Quercus suber]